MTDILSQLHAILYGETGSGRFAVLRSFILASLFCGCLGLARAQVEAASEPAVAASDITVRSSDFRASSAASAAPHWIPVPRLAGRLTSKDIGLVVNDADPYSVAVGAFYAQARKLAANQVLHVELPLKPQLSRDEFKQLSERIDAFFGPRTQALALAWTEPFAVECNSITGALALGFDPSVCAHSCAATRRSPYFDSPTLRPFNDLQMRLSMLLAAPDVGGAKAMIARGVAADRSLGWRGAPPAKVYFVNTSDRARSVRSVLFPPAGIVGRVGIDVHVENAQAIENVDHVLLYETGLVRVDKLDTVKWLPGALADHLTSTGGQLVGGSQMSALAWIGSGATASYGTVSEPCNHLQKFPHPQVLLLDYVQGSTAIEAYWRSVAWPQQGLFIGEPLAAPFARR